MKTDRLQSLTERLFAAHPELRAAAKVAGQRVVLQSPTGDARRSLTVSFEGAEPLLRFGDWEARASLWAESDPDAPLLRLVEAILADKVVLLLDAASRPGVHAGVMDLSDEHLMPKDWSATASSGRYRTLSWSGTADREIGA